ncbi:hypothetical protein [Anaplasma marginale]|nr:hypothetical protein [Anaplasma marginale]
MVLPGALVGTERPSIGMLAYAFAAAEHEMAVWILSRRYAGDASQVC